MTSRLPLPEQTARQIVSQRLRVATIRYSADASYPDGVPIGNHAKSFIVDDSVFYIGSQNTYRCNLNEFGYIVEDPDAARAYLDTYWTPLWNWSKNTVTTGVDPDLMAAFDAAVMTSAGTVDAYNAAISTFLRDQGYTCTALQVLAAFKAMRDKTLAYWTGSYTTWLINDGGVCYPNSSITPRTAAGTTLDSAGPVPELGPLLVVTPEGVTLDGAEVADLIYNDNELTWSGSGDAGSASLKFGTVTRATPTDSFTGAECFGTITYPDAGDGARHGTYSLYARVSGSSGEPGSTDGKSYTLAYILAALGLVGLLAVFGLDRFVSARRQADLARAEPEEEGASRPPFSEVTSWRRVSESAVINRINARERLARERLALEDAARYESGMSLADRGRLASDMRRVQATEEALENPTAQALPDVVQTANAQLNSVATSMRELFGSIGSKLSAQARTQLAESSQAADDLGKVYDDIMEQREKGEPFEFEIEDL